MQQLAGSRVEPQGVEDQPLLRLAPEHVLGGKLRRNRRVIGVLAVGGLVPAEDLRHLVVRTRLVQGRRVDPVAREHPAGAIQHLDPRLFALRDVQQDPF